MFVQPLAVMMLDKSDGNGPQQVKVALGVAHHVESVLVPSCTQPLLQTPPAAVPVLVVPPDPMAPPVAAVPPEPTVPPVLVRPPVDVLLAPPAEVPPAAPIAGSTACTVVVVGKSKGASTQVRVALASQVPELDASVAQNRAM